MEKLQCERNPMDCVEIQNPIIPIRRFEVHFSNSTLSLSWKVLFLILSNDKIIPFSLPHLSHWIWFCFVVWCQFLLLLLTSYQFYCFCSLFLAVRYGRVPKRSRELSGSDENAERDKRKRKHSKLYLYCNGKLWCWRNETRGQKCNTIKVLWIDKMFCCCQTEAFSVQQRFWKIASIKKRSVKLNLSDCKC